MVSCCSCNVTPNALNSLTVKADLASNTLTPIIPSSLVIKVVATQGGAACTASSAATVNTAVLQPGLEAWGTSLTALPVTPGTPAGTYGVIETPFSLGTITPAELARMAQLCAFIRANGSGYGICKSRAKSAASARRPSSGYTLVHRSRQLRRGLPSPDPSANPATHSPPEPTPSPDTRHT